MYATDFDPKLKVNTQIEEILGNIYTFSQAGACFKALKFLSISMLETLFLSKVAMCLN